MCIISAYYFHTKKGANWALNIGFFYALVLMLLIKLVSNSTIKRCSSGIILFIFDITQFVTDSTSACSSPLQIRYHKSAGTKCTNVLLSILFGNKDKLDRIIYLRMGLISKKKNLQKIILSSFSTSNFKAFLFLQFLSNPFLKSEVSLL